MSVGKDERRMQESGLHCCLRRWRKRVKWGKFKCVVKMSGLQTTNVTLRGVNMTKCVSPLLSLWHTFGFYIERSGVVDTTFLFFGRSRIGIFVRKWAFLIDVCLGFLNPSKYYKHEGPESEVTVCCVKISRTLHDSKRKYSSPSVYERNVCLHTACMSKIRQTKLVLHCFPRYKFYVVRK
jgi:transposase InsO family protein